MTRVNLKPDEWLDHPALARETYRRMTNEGIVLASLDPNGKLNPMTIGWGVFGLIWGRPMFEVLVRPSRYTYRCLEHTGDYTVNVLPEELKDVPEYCGTTSGRTTDKMTERGLTPLASRQVTSPGIAEADIVFECKVVHHNDVQPATFIADIITHYYPEGDFHRVYFGQILAVSVAKGFLDRTA